MSRRRDSMAPYEIMGAARSNGAPPAEPPDEPIVSRRSLSAAVSELWDSGVPVVVRLPRGFAVLICVGVLALVVLSYCVGYARGGAAVRGELADQLAQFDRAAGRAPASAGRVVDVQLPDLSTAAQGDEAPATTVRSGDPRRANMNYLILARLQRTEAERLARFLAGRGVETGIVPADNARFVHVVALRGFTTDQYRAGAQAEYERQMRQLGRDWQSFNGGRGSNLSDMYWQLYTGPR